MPAKLPALALLASILLLAGPAQAIAFPGAGDRALPTFLAEVEDEAEVSEDEAGGEEDEWCEVVEEEEECEEAEEGGSIAPPECLLSSAEATVFAAANQDRVRLQIRYRAAAPTAVTIAYGLHGAKGSLFLGNEKKRLGKKGVLRFDRDLNEAQMAKVVAAKDFTVRLRPSGAPDWCQPYFERQLDLKRATPSGFSWEQSE